MKKISIIIVTYNSTNDIRGCLSSIYENNDIGEELEVIVVDNKSSDIDTLRRILSSDFPQVLLIENTKNGGYGQGNNVGIEASSAPIIMIMNPDVRLFKPVFSVALIKFKKRPNLALLGMRQFNAIDKVGASFLAKEPTLFNLMLLKLCLPLCIYIPKLFFISGACFFIRKSYFKRIGCFDEKIFLYGEETDINERLLADDKYISFEPKLGYIHPTEGRGDSFVALNRGFKSALYLYEKNQKSPKRLVRIYIKYYKLLLARAEMANNLEQVKVYKSFLSMLKTIKI